MKYYAVEIVATLMFIVWLAKTFGANSVCRLFQRGRVDSDTALKVRATAQSQGAVEELVGEVLRKHASKDKRPRNSGIGKFDSVETDIFERAEKILKEAARHDGWR